jgi:hypothetical protein
MATKKKNDNTIYYVLGAGVLAGGIYFLWPTISKLWKKDDTTTDETKDENTPVIDGGGSPAPNIVVVGGKKVTPGLSGIGTKKDNLNLDQPLKFGDYGQEVVKLQQILNRISKIMGTQTIKEDGDLGSGTQSKLTKIYGAGTINLYKAYLILFAVWNAKNNKDLKNWFKKYYSGYLNDPARLADARKFYYANNSAI